MNFNSNSRESREIRDVRGISHQCSRCGRRFARAENLRRHQSRKRPCENFSSGYDTSFNIITPSWDPIPDAVPIYQGNKCPFCLVEFPNISNRNRHIRHGCDMARRVFIQDTIQSTVRDILLEFLNDIRKNHWNSCEILEQLQNKIDTL
jgi:hypothetical protein